MQTKEVYMSKITLYYCQIPQKTCKGLLSLSNPTPLVNSRQLQQSKRSHFEGDARKQGGCQVTKVVIWIQTCEFTMWASHIILDIIFNLLTTVYNVYLCILIHSLLSKEGPVYFGPVQVFNTLH